MTATEAPFSGDSMLSFDTDDGALDQAIDDLRGVLRKDAAGAFHEGAPDMPGADPGETRPGSALESNLDLIMDIPIDLQIVLGSSQMQVSGLMNLAEGATIALDRKIGEPVDVMVNGRIIGRGEITVLEGDDTRFGVKLTEVRSTHKT